MNGDFLLHVWGGFYNEKHQTKHGEKPGYYWFHTPEQRQSELVRLRKIEDCLDARNLAFSLYEGNLARQRLVAKMIFAYGGREYPFAYDFGFGFETENAEYMFFDGNYSCDCNRSLFIGRSVEGFPELGCGNKIAVKEFTTEYIPRTGEAFEPPVGD